MKRQILSRASISGSSKGALAEVLTSSRRLVRDVTGLLLAVSTGGEPTQSAAVLDVHLDDLKTRERALQESLQDVQDSASSEAIMLHLGTIYTLMARLKEAMNDEASSLSLYATAGKCFETVPPSVLISDEEAALHYLWTLENIQRRDLAIQFLVSAASLGKLPVSAYLEVTRKLDRFTDAELRTKLLRAALTRTSGNARELQRLADELESEGQLDLAVMALSEATHLYIDRDELVKALACCERLSSIRPDHLESLALHGYLLVELGQISEALPKLLRAVDAFPDATVRLSLAKALTLAQQPAQSFRYLDEVLKEEPGNIEALCLKAEACNRLDRWDEALAAAELAILQHPRSADDARLQKGIALYGLQRFADAFEVLEGVDSKDMETVLISSFKLDLRLRLLPKSGMSEIAVQAGRCAAMFLKAGPSAALAANPLVHVLRKLERWEDVIGIVDHLLESDPESIPLAIDKSSALRNLGRQDAALLEISRLPHSAGAKVVPIKASLLCDIGDFEGALDVLVPATNASEILSPDSLALLSLRAWADQNCPGDQYALDGEQTYRRILARRPDDYWSHKGLANALLRLKRREEANKEYEVVIEFAEKMKLNRRLDPYDSILAGWCFYCTNRFKQAAEAYESGLAATEIGIAAQFDYALVLVADTSFSAAQFQYRQSIADTQSKNPLRRCGLLYVSLSDLCNAFVLYPHIASAEEAYGNRQLLREALRKAVKEFPSTWQYLADRLNAFLAAEEEDAEATKKRAVPPRIVGFNIPNPAVPCAIIDPTVTSKSSDRSFYPLFYSPSLLSTDDQTFAPPKILWLTRALVEAMGLPSPHSVADRLRWEKIDQPIPSWGTVTTLPNARDIMDEVAKRLIDRSVKLLADDLANKSKQNAASAQEAAQFALAAACDETIKYQALIGYGAAGGDTSEAGASLIQSGETGHLLSSADALDSSVEEFKKGVESRVEKNRADQGRSVDNTLQDPPANLVDYVLDRVGRIAQIENVEAQDRSAAQASANMWLLVPTTPELESCRERLSQKLSSEGTFYLDDESVLAMSREPAFYSTSVLRTSVDRHLLDSFAFFRAAMRMQRSLPWLASALEREKSLQLRTL